MGQCTIIALQASRRCCWPFQLLPGSWNPRFSNEISFTMEDLKTMVTVVLTTFGRRIWLSTTTPPPSDQQLVSGDGEVSWHFSPHSHLNLVSIY